MIGRSRQTISKLIKPCMIGRLPLKVQLQGLFHMLDVDFILR